MANNFSIISVVHASKPNSENISLCIGLLFVELVCVEQVCVELVCIKSVCVESICVESICVESVSVYYVFVTSVDPYILVINISSINC